MPRGKLSPDTNQAYHHHQSIPQQKAGSCGGKPHPGRQHRSCAERQSGYNTAERNKATNPLLYAKPGEIQAGQASQGCCCRQPA
jgi:hypothetical protein